MSSIFTTSLSSFSISTTTTNPATYNAAGYGALTYQAACPLQNIGAFGTSFESATFDDICTGVRMKIKGINDNGEMEVVLGYDDTDAGQVLLKTASLNTTTANYHFKVTFPNKQNATGADSIFYFSGKVMKAIRTPGAASDVVTLNSTIGINTAIVEVLSTAGV